MIHRIIGGAFGLYHVVPPDEAHVRVLSNKKELFMSRGKDNRPGYWTVPFVTKMTKLPLTNIRIDVPDVKLNDSDMAKFMCDIVCFVNIINPTLAAERTGITVEQSRYEGQMMGIQSLSNDFRAIMESVGRTVGTKQTILDIYKDRTMLDSAVTKEIEKVFPQWGLELVDLEIKDIKDVPGSTIISDIEKKQAAVINADARVKVATETRRAEISEAENKQAAEVRKAETEEIYRKRQILKDQEIAIADQEKQKTTAIREAEANEQKVEARRKIEVGTADVDRQAIMQRAEADKQKLLIVAEGRAKEIESVGNAEADIIKAKKVADAEGTEKLAYAQQKFNDSATNIEIIKAMQNIQIAYAKAQEAAYSNAKINIVAGSTQELLSGGILGKISVGPKEGVSMQQLIDQCPQVGDLLSGLLKKNDKVMPNAI